MNKWNIFKKHGSFLSKLAFAGLVLASIILEFLAVRSHMTLANSLCDSPYFDPVANVCYMLIACIVVLTLTICGLCVVVDESVKNYYKKKNGGFYL
jgi:hypothetical protein